MTLNTNQIKLLNNLLLDQKKAKKKLYSTGPYWNYKTKKISVVGTAKRDS